ncbi:ComEA family DNA-binding protein [Paenibacillus prosopidis]|uniref:Competence protein ComEA n=1 Tax=Paenibacillus prosopidis TaxID=630520 RepID=A0A368W7M5_9BACL|nr:ComEA family DNA-binding protein [Paenibacillus prosopidis]RCW51332.1 competence protein ComEA [Paenibacillus prosopidis]
MKHQSYGFSNKQLLLAAVCIVVAATLLAAALFEPKRPIKEEWVPLNEAVEAALSEMEKRDIDEGKMNTVEGSPAEQNSVQEAAAVDAGKVDAKEEEQHTSDAKLDINRATAAELDTLKGIGPSKAQAIIEDREKNGRFTTIDDLLRVNGIGEKLLSGIQESIVARP